MGFLVEPIELTNIKMLIAKRDREFIERVKEKRKHCMKPANYKEEEETYLNWLLPNYYDDGKGCCFPRCKMNTKDKNLWIVGSKEQCEEFIQKALGNDPTYVYNKTQYYWNNYFGQPFIVFRVYNKSRRDKRICTLRGIGDWIGYGIEKQKSSYNLSADLYHCIILSIYSPNEYCRGMKYFDDEIRGLEWRYDILDLRKRIPQKKELK